MNKVIFIKKKNTSSEYYTGDPSLAVNEKYPWARLLDFIWPYFKICKIRRAIPKKKDLEVLNIFMIVKCFVIPLDIIN